MFFSTHARNLTRHQILVVGILLEKGAGARRGVVLRSAKLATWSDLPPRLLERVIAQLSYLGIVMRRDVGAHYEYRVSLSAVRKLKQPTFPDRVSLGAQLEIAGFGRIPGQMRLPGADGSILIEDAKLPDLLKLREHWALREKNHVRCSGRSDQLEALIKLVQKHDPTGSGITAKQAISLEAHFDGANVPSASAQAHA